MYGPFVVWYIFLAGMGSGAYAISLIFSFIARHSRKRYIQEYMRLARGGYVIGPILVAIGAVFLLFDLGIPEKAFLALFNTRLSVLSIGVWSIVLFCLSSAALILIRAQSLTRLLWTIKIILQTVSFIFALGLMTYTGVFLSCMKSVPFHYNWFLVALFILSSFSTGLAVIALYGFFNQHRKATVQGLSLIPKIDLALLPLEILTLGIFLCTAYSGGTIARLSCSMLIDGDMAPLFWVGAVLIGLIVPLLCALRNRKKPLTNLIASSAVLTIVGGFFLRYSIINAGIHIFDYTFF